MADSLIQHVFSGDRMQAFSDAVFAIMATVLVEPLKLSEDDVHRVNSGTETLASVLLKSVDQLLIYGFVFITITQTWYNHVRVFRVVDRVDGFVVWMNLLCLFFTSLLPFTGSLAAKFADVPATIAICAANVFCVWIALTIILFYGLRKQKLIHPEMMALSDLRIARIGMYAILLVIPLFCILSIGFSFVDYRAGWAFFAPIVIISLITRLLFRLVQKCRGKPLDPDINYLLKSVANKERTEFFTDGVFSIVATLIVLDLTNNGLPEYDLNGNSTTTVKELASFFATENLKFQSFITTFIILGLLWAVHHSMFHFIRKMSPMMSLLNSVSLCLVGLIPFVSNLLANFASLDVKSDVSSKNISLQYACVVVFLISVAHLLVFLVARINRRVCLVEEVGQKSNTEGVLLVKMLVFPIVSFTVYWATFSEAEYFNRALLFEVERDHSMGCLLDRTPQWSKDLTEIFFWSAPIIFIAIRVLHPFVNKVTKVVREKMCRKSREYERMKMDEPQ